MIRLLKLLLRLAWFGFVLAMVALLTCNGLVNSAAFGRDYSKASQVPEARVVLLLGCTKKLKSGFNNAFFWRRIEAAEALYKAGKAKAFIVSGDNHTHGYDEPTDMKAALVERGVPAGKIYCDYAGFRTLDSIVRAKEVFSQTKLTVLSQRFHTERTLYLADHFGIDAIAFNAADVRMEWALKTYAREAFARVKAVLDVTLLNTQPKFLGPRVSLDQPPQDAQLVPEAKKG